MLQRPTKIPRTKENQHNISMKTVKIVSQYNISDYLPPSQDYSQSRSIVNIHRFRDKVITEPVQRFRQTQNDELYKKIALLEQEKIGLKAQLEKVKRDLVSYQESLQEKDNELRQTKQKSQQYLSNLTKLQKLRVPRTSLQRNIFHFQIFPKFKQSYQVSVQTDPAIEQHSLSKQTRTLPGPIASDMQHIYQKMQNLKMGRRISKPQLNHLQPNFTSNYKAERPRTFSSNWGSYDKENLMRNSNLMDKKPVQKRDKAKDETLDLFAMPLQQGQKLLAAYIDDSYM